MPFYPLVVWGWVGDAGLILPDLPSFQSKLEKNKMLKGYFDFKLLAQIKKKKKSGQLRQACELCPAYVHRCGILREGLQGPSGSYCVCLGAR